MGETNCNEATDKRLISKIRKQLTRSKSENKLSNEKMGRRPRDISPNGQNT